MEKLIKTFTVDWNNVDEVSKLFQDIKSRYCESIPNRISKKERHRRVIDACTKIINTDIQHLYSSILLDEKKDYYVYAHLDTSKKIDEEKLDSLGIGNSNTYYLTCTLRCANSDGNSFTTGEHKDPSYAIKQTTKYQLIIFSFTRRKFS